MSNLCIGIKNDVSRVVFNRSDPRAGKTPLNLGRLVMKLARRNWSAETSNLIFFLWSVFSLVFH